MDARLSEAINSPFSLIQAAVNTASDAWTAAGNAPGDAGLPADWLDNATNEFAAVLAADGAIDKIPVLTAAALRGGHVRPNTLVRFVGMVQDVFDPELYPSVVASPNHAYPIFGAFRDSIDADHSEQSSAHLLSRTTLYVVPPPGESAWARAARGARDSGDGLDATLLLQPTTVATAVAAAVGVANNKRGRGTEGGALILPVAEVDTETAERLAARSVENPLEFPTLRENEVPALLRLYSRAADAPGDIPFRVADLIETIAIYTSDAELHAARRAAAATLRRGADGDDDVEVDRDIAVGGASDAPDQRRVRTRHAADAPDDGNLTDGASRDNEDDADFNDAHAMLRSSSLEEDEAHHPPPSSVPRLHAVLVRRLPPGFPAMGVHAPTTATLGNAGATAATGPFDWCSGSASTTAAAGDADGVVAPVITAALRSNAATVLAAFPRQTLSELRSAAIGSLSTALGGDDLAAEYVLMWALSSIAARRGEVLVGKLSLALCGAPEASTGSDVPPLAIIAAAVTPAYAANAPADAGAAAVNGPAEDSTAAAPAVPAQPLPVYGAILPLARGASALGRRIAAAVSELFPRSVLLPLRLDNLNAVPFAPHKDANTCRLHSGLLQLAPGTCVVVDETVLGAGTLNAQGISNMRALASVAGSSSLPYSFPFYETAWPVDTPVLVIATGARPLTPVDIPVFLQPGSSGSKLVQPAAVVALRAFLVASRAAPFALSPAGAERIQEAWMDARRAGVARAEAAAASGAAKPALVTDADLHRWISLARLAAISHGESDVSAERLATVLELERMRSARNTRHATAQGGGTASTPRKQ